MKSKLKIVMCFNIPVAEGRIMNINVLTSNFSCNYRKNEKPIVNTARFATSLQPLTKDTVSFSGRLSVPIKAATNSFTDCMEKSVENSKDRMTRIATTYLDVLESIASSLKADGFSFDRVYCEKSPVKSAKSYVSKIARSKSLIVPDVIRSTMYCNNLYDLSLINKKLLPEMRKRGYVLAEVDMPVKDLMKRGFIPQSEKHINSKVNVPDLDIRLEDVSDQGNKLPQELRYSIGKPQKSGYEDIQMRFIRISDKNKTPINHELILLFGPNYANAKHIESEKVYSYLREFENLDMKFTDKTIGSNSQKAERYTDLIKQMFRGKVSQKLFLNAKNKDLYQIEDEIPIKFTDDDKKLFDTYFAGLRDRLNRCYNEQCRANKGESEILKDLKASQRHDSNLLKKIHDGLNKTITYFNNLNVS